MDLAATAMPPRDAGKKSDGNPLLRFIGNAEIKENTPDPSASFTPTALETGISAYISRSWDDAWRSKREIEGRMLAGMRARNGEYSADKLNSIRQQGGTSIYMMLTEEKCRAAVSWINDILRGTGERPWSIEPTPIADLPPEATAMIMQRIQMEYEQHAQQAIAQGMPIANAGDIQSRIDEIRDMVLEQLNEKAGEISKRMEDKIADQFAEGGFDAALSKFIEDLVTFPSAFIKGPINRSKSKLTWFTLPDGSVLPKREVVVTPEIDCPSPYDIYPSPGATDIDDGDLIERHRMRPADLRVLKGVPGFNDNTINAVLDEYGKGGLANWTYRDQERADLQDRGQEWLGTDNDRRIEALEFWGTVQGRMLTDWSDGKEIPGLPDGETVDPLGEYDINAWKIGRFVIGLRINDEPLGRKPYSKSSYSPTVGSFWGKGIPELISDVQAVCNSTARALVNNMGLASGPQVEVSVDRLAPGENITTLKPWRIWQTQKKAGTTSANDPAIQFYQPQINANELLMVFKEFEKKAGDIIGLPSYSYGDSRAGGAGRTASGLSMLMTNASKGIKQVIKYVDDGILEPIVYRYFIYNMIYSDDNSIKGDLKIVARGSQTLIMKEQMQIRVAELLTATGQSPVDLQIMGMQGRAHLLRAALDGLDMPIDKVVPDPDKFADMMPPMEPGQQGQGPAPVGLDSAGAPSRGQDHNLMG